MPIAENFVRRGSREFRVRLQKASVLQKRGLEVQGIDGVLNLPRRETFAFLTVAIVNKSKKKRAFNTMAFFFPACESFFFASYIHIYPRPCFFLSNPRRSFFPPPNSRPEYEARFRSARHLRPVEHRLAGWGETPGTSFCADGR